MVINEFSFLVFIFYFQKNNITSHFIMGPKKNNITPMYLITLLLFDPLNLQIHTIGLT